MEKSRKKFETVEAYLADLPKDLKAIAKQVRKTIREAAPQADEMISYGIPGYKWNGMLIYFAVFKNHIGLYPAPKATGALEKQLAKYREGKATIRLAVDAPLPLALITKFVKWRMKQNLERVHIKKASTKT
jgi:uncharacterized protein YdhG (YjbR/CyaY superfamily)